MAPRLAASVMGDAEVLTGSGDLQLLSGPQRGRDGFHLVLGGGVEEGAEAGSEHGFDRKHRRPAEFPQADAEQTARIAIEYLETEHDRVLRVVDPLGRDDQPHPTLTGSREDRHVLVDHAALHGPRMSEVLAGDSLGLSILVEAPVEHARMLPSRLDQRQTPNIGIHGQASSSGLIAHHGGGGVRNLDAGHGTKHTSASRLTDSPWRSCTTDVRR